MKIFAFHSTCERKRRLMFSWVFRESSLNPAPYRCKKWIPTNHWIGSDWKSASAVKTSRNDFHFVASPSYFHRRMRPKSQFSFEGKVLFIALLRAHTFGYMARKIIHAINTDSVSQIREHKRPSHLCNINRHHRSWFTFIFN